MVEAEGLPPSASIASAGPGLRYIGEYCYAYSGAYASSSTAADHIDFISGEGLILGRLYVNGAIDSGSGSGEITTFTVKVNEITIAMMKTETIQEDNPGTVYQDLLIPPFTRVQVEVDSAEGDPARKTTVTFTGRVYDV